jgi:hypothetical protein
VARPYEVVIIAGSPKTIWLQEFSHAPQPTHFS